jgi:hypothetical protein
MIGFKAPGWPVLRIGDPSRPDWTRRFMSRVAALVGVATALVGLPQIAAAADEKPIASTASQNGKLRVEILSLKRIEADLVTLRWQIVNDDVKDFSMTPANARLLDLAGRREFSPGIVSNGCRAESGKRTLCWATFGAPPQGTKTMAVKFYENLEMVLGVPVMN